MGDAGVHTEVTLTCQNCDKEVFEDSDDAAFNAEKAIENQSWGWSDADTALWCDDCLEKEHEE